jgi:polyphosphate kinase
MAKTPTDSGHSADPAHDAALLRRIRGRDEGALSEFYDRHSTFVYSLARSVVRDEGDHLKQYVHVGTGNYNPITARIYEDLGLFTADPELAAEVAHLFNYITGYSRDKRYRCLLVAPQRMRDRMIGMIEREAEPRRPSDRGGSS